jgi:hypothetical protein
MSTLTVGGRASGGDATTTLVLDDFAYVDDRRVLFNYDEFDLRQEIGVAGLLEATASILRRTGDMLLRGSPNALTELLKAAAERERAYIRLMEQEESGDG